MPGKDIFLSYASEDRDRILPLVRALEGKGWTVFWDRTIPAGKTWRQVIGEEIRGCRSVVVVWSRMSVEKEWVQEESEEGKGRRILVPVLVDAVEPPFGFGSIQAADLLGWDGSSSAPPFQRLVKDLGTLLGAPPAEREDQDGLRRKQAEAARRPPGRSTNIVERLLRVAEQLAELSGFLQKAHRERRERVAGYCEHIADVLQKAAAAFRSGGVPNAEVGELMLHSAGLFEILSPVLPVEEVRRVTAGLGRSIEADFDFSLPIEVASLTADASRSEGLAQIERTAGLFRGVASLLRAAG